MALEREDAPFHLSHRRVEETLRQPQRMPELDLHIDSPSKDSEMSDETVPASAADVQMILEANSQDLESPLVLQSVIVPPTSKQGDTLDDQRLAEVQFGRALPHPPTSSTPRQEQIADGSQTTAMLTPTTTFTPRRSPRASTSASSSRANSMMPEAKDFTPSTAPTMPPRALNTSQSGQARTALPERIHAPTLFREGFISSAMPSPSIFQVGNESISSERQAATSQNQSIFSSAAIHSESITPVVGDNGKPNTESDDYAEEAVHHPHGQEMDVNMNEVDEDSFPPRLQATSQSPDSSYITGLPFTPSSLSKVPHGLQFPSSTADLSTLFSSPVPQLSQPVLSPFRLHQNFQSFSMPPPSAQASSTPPPITPPLQEGGKDMFMRPVGPTQSSVSKEAGSSLLSLHSNLYSMLPETPDIQPEAEERHGYSLMPEATATTISTPPRISDLVPGHPMTSINSPQTIQVVSTPEHPMTALQGSLTPLIAPISLARLPFPITPQRSSRSDFFTPVRNQSDLFAPVGNNPQPCPPPFAHKTSADIAATPSKIPVSVSTPAKFPSSLDAREPSLATSEAAAGSRHIEDGSEQPSLLSPPTASQLRQPSNLRNTAGAASKIPRPGKKPYSKPISRLPKPGLSTKVLSPVSVSSVASSKVSSIIAPVSPIKTRRGRANQVSTSAATQPRSAGIELPPDVIIYEPPAPRTRPKIDNQESIPIGGEGATIEVDGNVVSGRASPPVETGMSPPKSGLFLKSESRRLKQEVAINPPGSVIPQFLATAPSLGIFPSLTRPKGKSRNTLIRPMMMPLDPTSLRNLTTSNTLRNQHYVCSKVETKVILKEGKRPASPTTKVKTILEKKKEEQEKSREERAARRIGKAAQANGHDHEMTDSTEDPAKRKHPRGAGDEDDYETPTKPERAEMDVDEDEGTRKRKRVKWDKDLLQRFELDETNMEGIQKAAELAKARMATKSCLAAQVLLDPLGNVPQADVPIANLPKEQVVVTRLVYIEDLPPSERPKRVAATKANARINIGTA